MSSEPQLTPIRTALSLAIAVSIMAANCASRFSPLPTLPGIDAVLGQRLGTFRILREQAVAIEMKITDQGHRYAARIQALADRRHRTRRLLAVDRDTHQFRSGARQSGDLIDGAGDIRGIGVGHRLHHHRGITANDDIAHASHPRFCGVGLGKRS